MIDHPNVKWLILSIYTSLVSGNLKIFFLELNQILNKVIYLDTIT